MPPSGSAEEVGSLLTVLRDERLLLEELIECLTESALLMDAGRTRYLPVACSRILSIERQLGHTELLRAMLSSGLALSCRMRDDNVSLRSLIGHVGPDDGALLEEELRQLRCLSEGIGRLKRAIKGAAQARLASTIDLLGTATGTRT